MNSSLQERIENMILSGETIKEVFDFSRAVDVYILERLAYHHYALPLMNNLSLSSLPQDAWNNCLIDMYVELKKEGKILLK